LRWPATLSPNIAFRTSGMTIFRRGGREPHSGGGGGEGGGRWGGGEEGVEEEAAVGAVGKVRGEGEGAVTVGEEGRGWGRRRWR